jgi:hypothetical protein
LARKHSLGHLTAKALNAQMKAVRRIEREKDAEARTISDSINPLLDIWVGIQDKSYGPCHGSWYVDDYEIRRECVKMYAWAIPTEDAIKRIVECGPIVEIGAGSGYWANLITHFGGDVLAYDKYKPEKNKNYSFECGWFDVQKGGPEKATEHSDRALFLCWPPYAEPFASECLAAYKGNTVIFVGEGWGGCTGDDAFFKTLGDDVWDDDYDQSKAEWEKVCEMNIPQWSGIHDYLMIFKRKTQI